MEEVGGGVKREAVEGSGVEMRWRVGTWWEGGMRRVNKHFYQIKDELVCWTLSLQYLEAPNPHRLLNEVSEIPGSPFG